MTTAKCPEMPDLLDHMEGRAQLGDHLKECGLCRDLLSDLRATLRAEEAAFAPPSEMDVERALANVRGKARGRSKWGGTLLVSAAAAVTLALLLPAAFVNNDPGGPVGGGEGMGVPTLPARDVEVRNPYFPRSNGITRELVEHINSSCAPIGTDVPSKHAAPTSSAR